LAGWYFNLYIDPKEEMPVGHRRNAWLASVTAKLKAHGATFKKYPHLQYFCKICLAFRHRAGLHCLGTTLLCDYLDNLIHLRRIRNATQPLKKL